MDTGPASERIIRATPLQKATAAGRWLPTGVVAAPRKARPPQGLRDRIRRARREDRLTGLELEGLALLQPGQTYVRSPLAEQLMQG